VNAPHRLERDALAAIDVRERRRRRAAVAARLVASGADAAAVDWDTLDAAPAWLALSDSRLATLQRQIGALVHAAEIRLWIDNARIAAARHTLGEAFLRALLAQRDLAAFPHDAGPRRRIDHADDVAPCLQMAGAAVLLAALPHGALRKAVIAAMAPTAPAPIAGELALSLIARAQSLAAPATHAPAAGAPASAGKDER
jgi:hypothetical protein